MEQTKWVLTALILCGAIGVGAQSGPAQTTPERPLPERTIPERMQPPSSGTQQPGLSGMSADQINKIKEALKAQGLDPGPMNGKFDSQAQQALRQFQQANNLPVTGALDQATAAKLGVTAGGRSGSAGQPDVIPPPGQGSIPGPGQGSTSGSQPGSSLPKGKDVVK